jgi:hypothetical protein
VVQLGFFWLIKNHPSQMLQNQDVISLILVMPATNQGFLQSNG